LPRKMEQTECSETSAYKIQTPGNYPEENLEHTEHGESLKSRKLDHLKRTRNVYSSRQETPCLLLTRWFMACSQVASFRALICHYYCASANLTTIFYWRRKLVNFLCILLLSCPIAVGWPYVTLHYISLR